MTKQIGTKEIFVNGQLVTVRVFAPATERREKATNYAPNEDTLQAMRLESVRGEQ